MECPFCGSGQASEARFCNQCGRSLEVSPASELPRAPERSERRQVSALFSDLSGYTAMSQRLDPEEIKEIMGSIFGQIAGVVSRYDGFIEKFVGDAVMVIFGVPQAHEDDQVRAIRAAMEIHALVEAMNPTLEPRLARALSMHSGINTGLVVTGAVDVAKGTHGLTGDTLNLASRLKDLAPAGQIWVGEGTFILAQGHFQFQALEPMQVKGKAEPVTAYRVLGLKEQPGALHRMQGLRSQLIGREREMGQLQQALERLKAGQGSIISIVGQAGTGKSRLVREFKAGLDLSQVQWMEGHAYAYTQNTLFYPLINLLTYAFQMKEDNQPEELKRKLEAGVKALLWHKPEVIPCLGRLFSLTYPGVELGSPEFWRNRLFESVQALLAAAAQRGPLVVFIEDLHWADGSFVELVHHLLAQSSLPVLFVLAYRPVFSLFPAGPPPDLAWPQVEMGLKDLSAEQTQAMLESLLQSASPPAELMEFIKRQAEGNPFYLEEVVNSLLETGALEREGAVWRLTRPLSQIEVPATIQGVLSARLDRLEGEAKRVLQEASVIGRAFYHKVLARISHLGGGVEEHLRGLEKLDLIRARALEPELEYIFKHALTQEVVYNGLLKKERRDIHERIGAVMEELFAGRLHEFYEALAFHYQRGHSLAKAVDYLMKAGKKSLDMFSVEESDRYYQAAYDLLTAKEERSREDNLLLVDLLMEWAVALVYATEIDRCVSLLSAHLHLARDLGDKIRLGRLEAELGLSMFVQGKCRLAQPHLKVALVLGEETKDPMVRCWAHCGTAFNLWDMESLDSSTRAARKALDICRQMEPDHDLFLFIHGSLMTTEFYAGNARAMNDIAEVLFEHGRTYSYPRSVTLGNTARGLYHRILGRTEDAVAAFKEALLSSKEILYTHFTRTFLGGTFCFQGQSSQAQDLLRQVLEDMDRTGYRMQASFIKAMLGVIEVQKGNLANGIKILTGNRRATQSEERKFATAYTDFLLGAVYRQLAAPQQPSRPGLLLRNLGFLIKTLPRAVQLAERHFNFAIQIFHEMGAHWMTGQAYLALGGLYQAKKRTQAAREAYYQALQIYQRLEIEFFADQAREGLDSLGASSPGRAG